MDCRTGNIYESSSEKEMEFLQAKFHQETERELVRLKRSDVKTLKEISFDKRRGWMRNKPCPCGSEVKFKRCCWTVYA